MCVPNRDNWKHALSLFSDIDIFSSWESVKLDFKDGTTATVMLDTKTVTRLQSGDEALLNTIHANLKASNALSMQPEPCTSPPEALKDKDDTHADDKPRYELSWL